MRLDYGDYYILDLNRSAVSKDVDPEKLAHKLGVRGSFFEQR